MYALSTMFENRPFQARAPPRLSSGLEKFWRHPALRIQVCLLVVLEVPVIWIWIQVVRETDAGVFIVTNNAMRIEISIDFTIVGAFN